MAMAIATVLYPTAPGDVAWEFARQRVDALTEDLTPNAPREFVLASMIDLLRRKLGEE
jgi:hypothetical protein